MAFFSLFSPGRPREGEKVLLFSTSRPCRGNYGHDCSPVSDECPDLALFSEVGVAWCMFSRGETCPCMQSTVAPRSSDECFYIIWEVMFVFLQHFFDPCF